MKRKSVLAIAIALVFLLSLSMLTACGAKHEFSSEWQHDETSHFHKCTIQDHTDVADQADHTFDAGVVTTAPTEAAAGVKTYTCTVCGYQKTDPIDRLAHVHTFNDKKWENDETNHWHPATCAHTDQKDSLEKHVWDEGRVTTPPTETAEGVRTYTCTKCARTKTASIDKLDHVHTFNKEVWEHDSINHWHPATCAHTGERDAVAPHDWNDGEITTPAGYGTPGTKTYTCRICPETRTEPIAALDAKDNTITLESGLSLDKTYDGTAAALAPEKVNRNGDGAITIEYKLRDAEDSTYIAVAPKNAGAYTVRVSIAATAEWKGGSITENFTIAKKTLTGAATKKYDGTATMPATLKGVVDGETVTATVTMTSKNVGAAVQSVGLTGKDAGNYSLAKEDVTAAITKADISGLNVSNASAYTEFFVGATYIPEPTTDYVEIGTGYGEMTVSWEMEGENGLWDPIFQGIERVRERAGRYRVRIQYAEGDNYNSEKTEYVYFTVKAKPRTLSVKSFAGKTYDGTPLANFTFYNLVNKFGASSINGVENITAATDSGEKYVEYRKKGEALWTKVTGTYIPKNAAEYEYRIGVTATDEWVAVVSEIKTFTIAQVEIKLEKGYITTTYILQNGDLLYLASHTPVAGETIALRLVNGKAGLELSPTNSNYVKSDQKKQVSIQYNLDCFRLVATTNTNVSNYKIVKDPKQTSVEITVPPSGNGISKLITGKAEINDTANNRKQLEMWTAVDTGSFRVGQTVIVSDRTGTKLLEAKILKVSVVDPDGDGTFSNTSQSGCVIPSDGKVRIDIDVTGITYDVSKVVGGTVKVK